ncbi:Rv3235 family protein [Mycobacterium heckeshornense]|uniref:Rv3235 family protein n=1 Tax=Mycobacterium heckeshornense TaxID=110505 RepID=UPI001F2A56CE|nr:Rv3235 family protein [Mycobacterium heckeshornense]
MRVDLNHCVAVVPVIDYEPPPRDVQYCRPVSKTALRRPSARIPRRAAGHHRKPAISPALQSAADFADAALRRVLEVIDRRRPVAQLRPLLTAGLVDSVLARDAAAASRREAAVLRRLRLQAAGLHNPPRAAEVFGTFSRGRRVHAIACRVEQLAGADGSQWQVVSLHIG